jgi:magnesium chelatase family protein
VIASIPSAVLRGVDGRPVSVEVHVANGLPGFTVVGLPDAAVRESRDRVRAAFASSGLPWPRRRITVNLAPSGMRKGGAGLDLPIAVGVLVASGVLDAAAVAGLAFVGELGLDGSLRGVSGLLVLVDALVGSRVVTADADAAVAAPADAAVLTAPTLSEVVARCTGRRPWPDRPPDPAGPAGEDRAPSARGDLADVRGQLLARRALEVAAAGGHHLLLVGPPGAGKTLLATRLPGLLPDLDPTTAREVARIRSVAAEDGVTPRRDLRPPFRAPHHGLSAVAMIGGGRSALHPGEIGLAHGGVLFLDELGEFPTAVLDALRQPLEDGVVRISRSGGSVTCPARFLLVAAMNPCPCGAGGMPGGCRCSPAARARYARRLSGPLLDRFDLALRLDRPAAGDLLAPPSGETTAIVAARVARVRDRARGRGVPANAALAAVDLDRTAPLDGTAADVLARHLRTGRLSARGLHRVRRMARTIADLDDGCLVVTGRHVTEALLLRGGRALLLGEEEG